MQNIHLCYSVFFDDIIDMCKRIVSYGSLNSVLAGPQTAEILFDLQEVFHSVKRNAAYDVYRV